MYVQLIKLVHVFVQLVLPSSVQCTAVSRLIIKSIIANNRPKHTDSQVLVKFNLFIC